MEKIRVLMVLGNTRRGGTQAFIMNVLRNIDRKQFQIDIAINNDFEGGWGPEMRALGCNLYISPVFKVYNWRSFKRWWTKFLSNHPYDIVHGHTTNSAGIYLKVAKRQGCKTIAHIHSTGFRGNIIERITKRIFSKMTREQADYWFACSGKAAQLLYGEDYAAYPNYYEMPNAIDVKRFEFNENTRNKIRNEIGVNADEFLCGHAGTFSVPKNHTFLLDVFSEICKLKNNARLLLIGEGVLKNQIETKAQTLGILDRIIFRQNLPNVNEHLMAMDLFIFPSLFEGFGMVSLEAQATGLNIIQSDAVPIDTHLTDSVVSMPLDNSPSEWAKKAISLPSRDRKQENKVIFNSKYNLSNTLTLITKLYYEMAGK